LNNMTRNNFFKHLLFFFAVVGFFGCGDDDNANPQQFGPFQVVDDNTVEMDGEISSSTLEDFEDLMKDYPEIDQIIMKEVPGSSNDEVNLLVSQKVHDNNIATHLADDGLIASGGVDFFLAGTTRTKGSNTMIGVHSWSDGTSEAADFPRGNAEHQPYIDYYISVGFSQTAAEEFYYFTINAAPAASIYYMTEAEIEQYGVLKP
ncbi:MAG: hypothetical protein AB8G22_22195, partial [Saprospiraceae bacterium]